MCLHFQYNREFFFYTCFLYILNTLQTSYEAKMQQQLHDFTDLVSKTNFAFQNVICLTLLILRCVYTSLQGYMENKWKIKYLYKSIHLSSLFRTKKTIKCDCESLDSQYLIAVLSAVEDSIVNPGAEAYFRGGIRGLWAPFTVFYCSHHNWRHEKYIRFKLFLKLTVIFGQWKKMFRY